jgi:hypothetical protein
MVYCLQIADTAAQFDGNFYEREDTTDDGLIDRSAFAGAVQIDDVDALGTCIGPSAGHFHRVSAVYGFPLEIPLEEPDAPAASDIDGWNDNQGQLLRNRWPGSDPYKKAGLRQVPGRGAGPAFPFR